MQADADGRVRVTGALTFATVSTCLKNSMPLFKPRQRLCFDLSAVTAVDSAALALLVEWLRLGRERGVQVEFAALPASLRSLAKVSDLGDVDPLLGIP
jgi:phospholipid transport system transporter-binding protein